MTRVLVRFDRLPDEAVLALAEFVLRQPVDKEGPEGPAIDALADAIGKEAALRMKAKDGKAEPLKHVSELVLPLEGGPDAGPQVYHVAYTALSHWIGTATRELQTAGHSEALKWLTVLFTNIWAELDEEHLQRQAALRKLESLLD